MHHRSVPSASFGVILSLMFCVVGQAFAQSASNFDIDRYSNDGENMFETFYVAETQGLGDALGNGVVADDTALLVAETAAGRLALLRDQMSFHHIAKGVADGKTWMATF